MGKIARAYGWDDNGEQQFVTINPLADEISLFKTTSEDVSYCLWFGFKSADN